MEEELVNIVDCVHYLHTSTLLITTLVVFVLRGLGSTFASAIASASELEKTTDVCSTVCVVVTMYLLNCFKVFMLSPIEESRLMPALP